MCHKQPPSIHGHAHGRHTHGVGAATIPRCTTPDVRPHSPPHPLPPSVPPPPHIAGSNSGLFAKSLRAPPQPRTASPFNKNLLDAKFPHETGFKVKPASPNYSFGRKPTASASWESSLKAFAAPEPIGAARPAMSRAVSAKPAVRHSRPSGGIYPQFTAPITNFHNVRTPTAPNSYAPSYYPFPVGRHLWSTRWRGMDNSTFITRDSLGGDGFRW